MIPSFVMNLCVINHIRGNYNVRPALVLRITNCIVPPFHLIISVLETEFSVLVLSINYKSLYTIFQAIIIISSLFQI
ncbi:hypothetical protein CW304_30140 [Bacillus sp. UFRGS-B20]|nr:hypothetical protein CW304_30140 [Bacillus sp. UFRGS-B20]